jgi:hypothetical protein
VAAAAALAFTAPAALAQTAYKSEYRMSLVLGPAFPWGKGGELWAEQGEANAPRAASTSSSTPACR